MNPAYQRRADDHGVVHACISDSFSPYTICRGVWVLGPATGPVLTCLWCVVLAHGVRPRVFT